MLSVILNLAVILILAFCVWQGYRKGLILTICSVVIIFIAASSAGKIADSYAGKAMEIVSPVLDWLPEVKIDEAVEEVAKGMGPVGNITDKKVLREIAEVAFEKIGITGTVQELLTEKVMGELSPDTTIRQAIADNFLYGISYLILCVFAFLVIFILLTLIYHFVAAIFKLPLLGLIDKIGGSILGLAFGVLILCVLGWVLNFIGVFLPADAFREAGLVRMFMNMSWLDGLLNFSIG